MQRYDFFFELELFFIHRGVLDKIISFLEDMLSNGQTTVCFFVPSMKRRGVLLGSNPSWNSRRAKHQWQGCPIGWPFVFGICLSMPLKTQWRAFRDVPVSFRCDCGAFAWVGRYARRWGWSCWVSPFRCCRTCWTAAADSAWRSGMRCVTFCGCNGFCLTPATVSLHALTWPYFRNLSLPE